MDVDVNDSVLGAIHVALFPEWESIVRELCERAEQSGLLSATDRILVGIVGDSTTDVGVMHELLGEKAEFRRLGALERYEFPTLQWLYEEAYRESCACWYIHTKGASSMSDGAFQHRQAMTAIVVENHRACREVLNEYDVCGTQWRLDGFGRTNPHFAGNFWWSRTEYLRTLPPPEQLDVSNRYEAEFWIGKNPRIRAFEFRFQSDPFSRPSAWVGLESKYQQLCEIGDPGSIKCVVDIGVDYGFSTFCFARDFPLADVIGVDDFSLHADSESWVRSHQSLFPNLRVIKGGSPSIGKRFGDAIDILHIDGDHAFDSVVADFCAWMPAVNAGGRVIFHDIESFPEVRRFFDGLGGRKREIKEHHGLGCWFKQ